MIAATPMRRNGTPEDIAPRPLLRDAGLVLGHRQAPRRRRAGRRRTGAEEHPRPLTGGDWSRGDRQRHERRRHERPAGRRHDRNEQREPVEHVAAADAATVIWHRPLPRSPGRCRRRPLRRRASPPRRSPARRSAPRSCGWARPMSGRATNSGDHTTARPRRRSTSCQGGPASCSSKTATRSFCIPIPATTCSCRPSPAPRGEPVAGHARGRRDRPHHAGGHRRQPAQPVGRGDA